MQRIPLSRSQQNIYHGVLQDSDPQLYLIGKSYRFHPLELTAFLDALAATILENPVHLCVLQASGAEGDYPELVGSLQFGDIVRVRSDDRCQTDRNELVGNWAAGILVQPLARYAVRTDQDGRVSGLDVYTHHILLDGGATGIVEDGLARHLAAGSAPESLCRAAGLAKLEQAHRRESAKVQDSLLRLTDVVQRELVDQARDGDHASSEITGSAARGVLCESVRLSGNAFDALAGLSDAEQVPLNVLVATAAVAVHASLRQHTTSLLVHAVDNRFGDPELNVATCLVNSVVHSVRFPAFASVRDVVRVLDRGYVKAVRRRWLREEHYRRMYLAINRTSGVAALTLNFIREPCAPGLRPFLAQMPVATDIGPVEGMTVACVLDEGQRTLDIGIWDRADLPATTTPRQVAQRIAAALETMATMWQLPIAMTVDEWIEIGPEGACCQADWAVADEPRAPAWFLDPAVDIQLILARRRHVYAWIAWLVRSGAMPGDVVVCTDDNTDKTVDLLLAAHLAGCGYSVCDSVDEVAARVAALGARGVSARTVDVAAARLATRSDEELRALADARIAQVAQDNSLAGKTAYVMPTSGSTGEPKLVPIPHGSLALFCDAAGRAYGWGPNDTVLQCAPLTSDISVEEICCGMFCGSEVIRSAATRTGDVQALARDVVASKATVVDLPTAVWHLLCEDADAVSALCRSELRQVVVGGEAIRPSAVDKWVAIAGDRISLLSSYGPTEATVVATHVPIVGEGAVEREARLRLGRPMVANTVFVAFGEIVIVGNPVAAGYLGAGGGFGTVTASDGSRRRAFATADRVTFDGSGFPVFAGRRDAIVKISGKRVDTAEVTRRIAEDPEVSDVAVELHAGRLGVWFETPRTRQDAEDDAVAARIRRKLVSLGVSSFFVVAVANIPRKPNGKLDSGGLHTTSGVPAPLRDDETDATATGLAEVWSLHLGRTIRPESSLLDEGIGSLDLIRILPDTRRYLGRQLSILDLISADTASNLVCELGSGVTAEIEGDLAALSRPRAPTLPNTGGGQAIVVLGASGILGTGFARAVLDLKHSGALLPDVVFATRSSLPERNPWTALNALDGVRVVTLPTELGAAELDALLTDAGTVINCIGNTNVVVPYRELRPANVALVSAIAEACAIRGTRLVQLSTFVVNADVSAPRVTDPRESPYPYAASKSLAELVVATAPIDFTIARLPRVLGEDYQLHDSADVLVSVVDACIAMGAYPELTLTEEVTTGRAAATAILGLLPEVSGGGELGRGITVVHGQALAYAELLSGYGLDELDVTKWKCLLDQSDWAKRNPRRWSVVDAWASLGRMLGPRSYAEHLAQYPTIDLGVEPVGALVATPLSLRELLTRGLSPATASCRT
ncbi:AMP-binding protein [Mycobacterium angelicum]|uniref:AMP-binding protein n=1 Tax=Mycobacterium angelicum TaxID=470074 RepID=UPI0009F22211|nr:AMP-binding protein [Mycobacterium angelicum]MCV7199182.1 AMP-binding protein [Mycobacterium angelicum]